MVRIGTWTQWETGRAAMSEVVIVSTEGPVRWLVLNRPKVLNAIDGAVLEALSRGIEAACDDEAICAVVLAGEGRAFSTGGDLKAGQSMRAEHGPSAPVDRFLLPFQRLLAAMRTAPKPIVAAVHGFCLAGGLELVLACDLVLAAVDARFGDPRGPRGMLPALGGPWALLRALGTFRAKELLLTGAEWDAERMREAGLISAVHDPAVLREAAQRVAAAFANGPADSTALIKRMLNEEADLAWPEAAAREIELNRAHLRAGNSVTHGLAAFNDRKG